MDEWEGELHHSSFPWLVEQIRYHLASSLHMHQTLDYSLVLLLKILNQMYQKTLQFQFLDKILFHVDTTSPQLSLQFLNQVLTILRNVLVALLLTEELAVVLLLDS